MLECLSCPILHLCLAIIQFLGVSAMPPVLQQVRQLVSVLVVRQLLHIQLPMLRKLSLENVQLQRIEMH
jgi:hypothetical protein